MRLSVKPLREQITSPARTILLVLLAAAAIVFIIACSNVANLILARSVRREGELAVRAALGASHGALRRTLLAESLVLCGAGAVLGVLMARPLVSVVARFASRFSVRALEVTVDCQCALGRCQPVDRRGGRARLHPASSVTACPDWSGLDERQPADHARNQPPPARVCDDADCVLVRAARRCRRRCSPRSSPCSRRTPATTCGRCWRSICRRRRSASATPRRSTSIRKSRAVSASCRASKASRSAASCRGATPGGRSSFSSPSRATRRRTAKRTRTRGSASSRRGFFAVLGVPLLAGRDFTDDDRRGSEPVVIVSQSIAQRLFPNGDALNRKLWWTDPLFGKPVPAPHRRRRGRRGRRERRARTGADDLSPGSADRASRAGCSCMPTGDPYALVPAVTRVIHEMSANQPVERAATLEDVRAEVLAPERLNAFVFSGFAGVALLIAVVGVAGVLAFSVSARTREFGVRLAVGSTPRRLLVGVLLGGHRHRRARHRSRAPSAATRLPVSPRAISERAPARRLPLVGAAARPRRRRGARIADARRQGLTRRRPAGAAIGVGAMHQASGAGTREMVSQ